MKLNDDWLDGFLDGVVWFGEPWAVVLILVIVGIAWLCGAFN